MLAAFGPACITEVTRLTIQVPANAATSQAGVVGTLRHGHRGQRGHQRDLGGHVAEHVDPGAGGAGLPGDPGQLAVRAVQGVRHLPADQREQPDRPGRHGPRRRPRPASATTVTETASPSTRLARVSAVGREAEPVRERARTPRRATG